MAELLSGRYIPFERLANLSEKEVGHIYGLGVSGFIGSTIEIESAVFPAKKKISYIYGWRKWKKPGKGYFR